MTAYAPPKSASSAWESFDSLVQNEIDELFKRCHRINISEAHLRTLEDRVREIAVEVYNQRQSEAALAKSQGRKWADSNKIQTTQAHASQSSLDIELPQDDYQTLMEYNRVKYLTEEQQRRQNDLAKKKAVRDILDKQVNEVRHRRNLERKEEEAYGEEVARQTRAYEEHMAEKQQKERERFQLDKELREKQLAARREAERRRQQQKVREEAAELERIKADLAAVEQRRKDRILQDQATYVQFTKELEEQRAIREAEKKRNWDEDIQRSKEHAAKLEREEQSRLRHLDMLKNKASTNQQQFLLATADARAREIADQERINRVQKERREAEIARSAKAAADRKKKLDEAQKINQGLIANREAAKRQERVEFHESAKLAKQLAAQQRQIDLQAKERRLQQAADLRDALDRQVEEKRARDDDIPTRMTPVEAKINMDRFQAIVDDHAVHSLVKKTYRPHAQVILKQMKASRENQPAHIKSSYFQ